jgi:ADP-ribose pyrophosphatase YjhB (NUDIX family)
MGILDGWRFCPRCANPLDVGVGTVSCTSCGFVGWANSVPGAQALVERDGRVLLGRRERDPSRGLWDVPGGFLDEGEHPLDGLRRELREETGLDVDVKELLGFWMEFYGGRFVLCITWLAEAVGGTLTPGDDMGDLRWFAPDDLPAAAELAFPSFADILELWRGRQAGSGNDDGVRGDPVLEQDSA